MLKTRLIPALFLKNGLIVRSERFSYHQFLGNVVEETRRYSEWNVDELIYIDISREDYYDLRRDDLKVKSKDNIHDLIEQISKVSFMPLTFGGRIRTIDDIKSRLKKGADKICINTQAFLRPDFIQESAEIFGSQCIVVSIDYRIFNAEPIVFIKNGQMATEVDLIDWAVEVERRGAGEIFLNSIDRDGTAEGYDLDTIGAVADAVSIPVVACGGAGDFFDFVELAAQTDVSAIAAGNIFHFTERSYPRAKAYLKKNGINVR
jgi:cyclase